MKLQLSRGIERGLAVEFDEKSLKNAIIKLRDDPKLREEFGKNARKTALNYDWKILSKRMEEIMSANICHEEVLT